MGVCEGNAEHGTRQDDLHSNEAGGFVGISGNQTNLIQFFKPAGLSGKSMQFDEGK